MGLVNLVPHEYKGGYLLQARSTCARIQRCRYDGFMLNPSVSSPLESATVCMLGTRLVHRCVESMHSVLSLSVGMMETMSCLYMLRKTLDIHVTFLLI